MSVSFLRTWLLVLCVAVVAGCGGGGGGSEAGTPVLGNGAGTPVLGGGSTNTVTVNVQLLDSTGQPTTAVVAGRPVRAVATVARNGERVANQIVQFTLDSKGQAVAALDPVSGAILTDDQGVASLSVSSLGTATSAGQVIATASVTNATGTGSTSGTGSANFFATGSVGSQPATLTLSPVTFDSSVVSAYGTTGVKVQVLQSGAPYTSPVTVTFTTSCAAGKSTMTPSAVTQPSGYAVGTFVDNGCAQVADALVTITATISTGTASNSLTVKAPTAGSLRFVSATPSDKSITLRGQGGNGRQENAALVFQLVDLSGNGVADADICFDSTTYVGGLNLDGFGPSNLPILPGSGALCGTDLLSVVRYVKRTGADGKVSIQINAGSVPTPVRVRARTLYPSTSTTQLETFSDTLSISTGLPLQRSFSLSVDKANIDGGNYDGEIAKLTIRLADQFSNPVPDGTVVNFVASGGAVCTADNGSCKTLNGACTCDFTSQERRPQDNRVVVTAYAVGLEDFDDVNGNNQYDLGETFYDLADVFVDANKDDQPGLGTTGVACPGGPVNPTVNGDTDILVPYQQNTAYRCVGDGIRGTAHIRASTILYLSLASSAGDPTVVLPLGQLREERDLFTGTTIPGYFLRLKPDCPEGSPLPQGTLTMVLEDGIGNPMAAGTTLTAQDPSDNVNPGAFRPSAVLAIGTRPPSVFVDQPNLPKIPVPVVWTPGDPNDDARVVSRRAGLATPEAWTLVDPKGAVTTGHSIVVRGVAKKCFGEATFALSVQSPRGGAATARVLYDGEWRATNRSGFDVRYRLPANVDLTQGAAGLVRLSSATWVGPVAGPVAVSYVIDWGDLTTTAGVGSTIAPADRTHTYAANGTYFVQVTVTAGGQSYSGGSFVTVTSI